MYAHVLTSCKTICPKKDNKGEFYLFILLFYLHTHAHIHKKSKCCIIGQRSNIASNDQTLPMEPIIVVRSASIMLNIVSSLDFDENRTSKNIMGLICEILVKVTNRYIFQRAVTR